MWQARKLARPSGNKTLADPEGRIMSKITKELALLLSLLLVAAMVQFFAQSLPMALCIYFLPTLYSAYSFGRRHATLTAFACVFLVALMDFVNNLVPSHRVLVVPGERLLKRSLRCAR